MQYLLSARRFVKHFLCLICLSLALTCFQVLATGAQEADQNTVQENAEDPPVFPAGLEDATMKLRRVPTSAYPPDV